MEAAIVFILIGFTGGNGHLGPNGATPPFDVNQVINQVSHQQTTTGEFLLNRDIVYVPAPDDQSFASVAFDGENYLVVWQDHRNGSWDIYGARVSKTGTIIDPIGFRISPVDPDPYSNLNDQCNPSVASDGINFLVVWESHYRIYGSRVSQGGMVLDTLSLLIGYRGSESHPSVGYDGINYLVVWQDARDGPQESPWNIYGAHVNPSGTILDNIAISTAADNQCGPSIAFNGTNYFVVWEDYRNDSFEPDIYGARVSRSGTVLDPAGIPISTSTAAYCQLDPSVASDGKDYLVVWQSDWDENYCARVSGAGLVLDTAGIAITPGWSGQGYPSVAFGGSNYLIVWASGYYDIYGARVSPAGEVVDKMKRLNINSLGYHGDFFPSVMFGETNYLIIWHTCGREDDFDVFGARVSPDGIAVDPVGFVISTAVNDQAFPSVCFDGTNYLAVWGDQRGFYRKIYGARITSSGTILDPGGIRVPTGQYTEKNPSIAFDGKNYLVISSNQPHSWDYSEIAGTRVSPSGEILDAVGISIGNGWDALHSSIAFDGTNYLVVWSQYMDYPIREEYIYGARVSPSGEVLDTPGFDIWHGSSEYPAVGFDGTNYLVAVKDYYGVHVSPFRKVIDTLLINGMKSRPSLAFDGENYMVVWDGISGVRVSKSGNILDHSPIPIGSGVSPSIAFDGSNYIVVWQTDRNEDQYIYDIYGARVSPEGVVIDSFPVCTKPGSQIEPAIAKGLGGQLLIVWSGWTESINGKPANTMRIWGKFYPFTGIGETGDDRRKTGYELQIYPTPFFSNAVIRFSLPAVSIERSTMSLKIYDSSGRVVKEFKPSTIAARSERNHLTWDGTDDSCQKLPAGVYFCRLEAENAKITKKVIKLK